MTRASHLTRREFVDISLAGLIAAPGASDAWCGWMAMKVLSDAALRSRARTNAELIAWMSSERARFDGHKGVALTFDKRRQLRQPLYVVSADGTLRWEIPPPHALTNRGIVRNVRGYSIYGDYARPNPPMELIDAVVRGDIDVAVAWGPFAGWAATQGAPIRLTPVSPQVDVPFLPYVYDIALGVRRGDDSLKARLEAVLERREPEIRALLATYGVPLVETPRRRAIVPRGE